MEVSRYHILLLTAIMYIKPLDETLSCTISFKQCIAYTDTEALSKHEYRKKKNFLTSIEFKGKPC